MFLHLSVILFTEDPPPPLGQTPPRVRQPSILQNFRRKLYENKRFWTERGHASLASPLEPPLKSPCKRCYICQENIHNTKIHTNRKPFSDEKETGLFKQPFASYCTASELYHIATRNIITVVQDFLRLSMLHLDIDGFPFCSVHLRISRN